MLAYYVHHFSPFIFQFPNGMGPRWYGLAYVLAFAAGIWLYRKLAERGYSELPAREVSDFITWAALFGVMLGGRVGYFLFYDFDGLIQDPLIFFQVWKGGMASHGGILGLFFFTLYYARRHKISWTNLGDNLVVVAPIGLFFGRIANFVNGELYGRISHVPWAMQFPTELQEADPAMLDKLDLLLTSHPGVAFSVRPELLVEEARNSEPLRNLLQEILNPRHPSQLYEAALEGLLLFLILWLVRTRMKVSSGLLTGLFFILYAVFRIFGEQFREPDAPLIGSLTRGQFYSIFMVLIGAAFVVWSCTQRRKSPSAKNA